MDLKRRQKYMGHTHKVSKIEGKIKLGFDLSTFNIFCSYLISANKNIKRSQLINMRNLFSVLDTNEYKDDERAKRLLFIDRGLEARLDYGLTNPDMILKHINGGFGNNDIIDPENFITISNSELSWINGTVAKSLDYTFILSGLDGFIDCAMRIKAAEYTNIDEAVLDFKRLIQNANAEFRRHESRAISDSIFSLSQEQFETSIRETHEALSNPSNKLKTMMQGMNELINGGFEGQRVYFYFGLPGEGKSVTLLDIALQIKKANPNIQPKDPTKIPCVVLLTMENSVRETVERMWDMLCDREDMTHYSVEDVMKILREEGELYLNDDNPIDIIIKFVPGESVDTGYLYTLVEDLEDDGYECICLLQDYIKKIRPVYNSSSEIRVQYGSIVNEFKVFATLKDISVISASQLNRDATKHIDEARNTSKTDLVRLLGRSNIGESQLILENIDAGYFIAPEYDMQGNKVLGIQKIKSRFKPTVLSYFFQPYISRCEIKLVEDLNDRIPAFRTSMRPSNEQVQDRFNISISNSNASMYKGNSIKEYDGTQLLNDDNIYNRADQYSSSATNVACTNTFILLPDKTLINPIQKKLVRPLLRL